MRRGRNATGPTRSAGLPNDEETIPWKGKRRAGRVYAFGSAIAGGGLGTGQAVDLVLAAA